MSAKASGTANISSFARIVHTDLGGGSGEYAAIDKKTGERAGYIRYLVRLEEPVVVITGTYTYPDWRGRNVATALGERVHLDHPNHLLDLGGDRDQMPDGGAFWDRQKEVQPDWDDAVVEYDGKEKKIKKKRKEK